MKKIPYLFFIFATFLPLQCFGQLGKLIITYQPIYEIENDYFPHDVFLEKEMRGGVDNAVQLQNKKDSIVIINKYNDGFTGHAIEFVISDNLDIKSIKYEEWSDLYDGSTINYTVEKAIFSTDKNPFNTKELIGYYTLQIREDFNAGDILVKEGVKDTITYSIFNGKFRIYSAKEIEKGKKWVISQNEIKMGIKDSLGVYLFPDEFANYKLGADSLDKILQRFEILREETKLEKKVFVTLRLVVDEKGNVNPKNIEIIEPMNSDNLLNRVRSNKELLTKWHPAIYHGKSVKSEINLSIRIK